MDRNVLPQKKVSLALQAFVPVRLDATRERELANRYNVYGTPTYAIVQPNGQLVAKCQGYHTAQEFVAFIDRATDRMASSKPMEADRTIDPSTIAP